MILLTYLIILWLILIGFCAYMGARSAWYSMHWITKLLLLPVWLCYPLDWFFGFTFLTAWFRELPDWTEATISQRCKKHKDDSKLASFLWGEIRKIDPKHLGN